MATKAASLRSYLVLSDIHLGARETTADEILQHLTVFFEDFREDSRFKDLDVIFIAGDLFDDTIHFASDVIGKFLGWFHRFLGFCHQHRIKVRLLEGTPRHDRRQAATLATIVSLLPFTVDFAYVSALSIEIIDDLDLSVLYVPDECRHTAKLVEEDVEALLHEKGLQQVDIAIMHGHFAYQLGLIPMNNKVHSEDFYLSRVRHYLSIGHIHTASQYGRILAQGSFDRLSHGEEAPKGAMLIQEVHKGEWVHFFLENTLAKKYVTVLVKGTLEAAYKKIHRTIHKLPQGSHVRIEALSTHPIFQAFETLRGQYPFFVFKKKAKAEEDTVEVETLQEKRYAPIVLSRETLTAAVLTEVQKTKALSPEEERALVALLEDCHL